MNLTVPQLVWLYLDAGLTRQYANHMAGISMRESHGDPAAFNGNANTGDKSYGLVQINMIGKLGVERRVQFGFAADGSEDATLLDPYIQARCAKVLFDISGLQPWTGYRSGIDISSYKQWYDEAYSADPVPLEDIVATLDEVRTVVQDEINKALNVTKSVTLYTGKTVSHADALISVRQNVVGTGVNVKNVAADVKSLVDRPASGLDTASLKVAFREANQEAWQ